MKSFNRIKSLDTKKQISTKKKEKQVEFLNTVLERARDLISNENNDEIHPVFIFIKQFSDYISIKTAISSFENKQTFPKDYMECIFECRYSKNSSDLIERTFLKEIVGSDIEIYRKHHYRHFPKIMKISLSKIPLIVQPWNSDRVSYNISNVATNKNPFDLKKNGTIMNTYYYPIGLAICHGGNHSQYSAKLRGEGVSYVEEIVNIEKLYKYVTFDGNQFTYNFPNYDIEIYPYSVEPKNEEEFYAGVLFEIGRILLEKPEIFPKDILEIFENQNIL